MAGQALCPGMQPGQEDAEAEVVGEAERGCHRPSVAGSGPLGVCDT